MSKEPTGSTVRKPKPECVLDQRGLSPPKEARVPLKPSQAGWAGWRRAGCPETGELLGQAREAVEVWGEGGRVTESIEQSIKLQGCVIVSSCHAGSE